MLWWLEYTDIAVVCGTSAIELAVQVCPVIYAGYNVSLLILNHVWDNTNCHGTLDTSVAPPVVRFSFPIREGSACGSNFMVSIKAWVCICVCVSCNRVSAVQRLRPPAHQGQEYSLTSPTSSRSISAGSSGHMTPPLAPSPTTQSSSTTTRALTLWSISSTTPRSTCKCESHRMTVATLFSETAPPSSPQVVLLHRFDGQEWQLHQHSEHGSLPGTGLLRPLTALLHAVI